MINHAINQVKYFNRLTARIYIYVWSCSLVYGGQEGSQHMQLPKHTHIQKTPANSKKHLQTQKTPANSKKHLRTQKTPALSSQHVRCKYSQHEQIGKRTASNDNGNVSGGTVISDGPIAGWRFYSITDVKHARPRLTRRRNTLRRHVTGRAPARGPVHHCAQF